MNTGQVTATPLVCPRVARAMSEVLAKAKQRVGRWIGLSVVHLGDRDVPNALVFIDKYTQVRRILAPLVSTLDKIPSLVSNDGIKTYIENTFGDVHTPPKCQSCAIFFVTDLMAVETTAALVLMVD